MPLVRILVVDRSSVFRYGLRLLLMEEDWVDDVVEVPTYAEGERRAADGGFRLVVVDPHLADGDGVGAIRTIRQVAPQAGVLVATMTDDVGLLSRALQAGAGGVVSKTETPEVILRAVRAVRDGEAFLGPGAGTALIDSLRRAPDGFARPFDRLTPREREILALMASGETNGQIARSLTISDKTIRNMVSSVLSKLGASSRVQAVLLAREAGFTASPGE